MPKLRRWCDEHRAWLTFELENCKGGDLLFLVSCTEIVGADVRAKYRKTLVIHESDLPNCRGWSPLAWLIVGGQNEFVISLLEAEDRVDSGPIWRKETTRLRGDELADEINEARDQVRLRLMDWAVENFDSVSPHPQSGDASYCRRRTPEDSRIDPARPLDEQFDLLRICEPRFPAFFDLRGHRYAIELRKVGPLP